MTITSSGRRGLVTLALALALPAGAGAEPSPRTQSKSLGSNEPEAELPRSRRDREGRPYARVRLVRWADDARAERASGLAPRRPTGSDDQQVRRITVEPELSRPQVGIYGVDSGFGDYRRRRASWRLRPRAAPGQEGRHPLVALRAVLQRPLAVAQAVGRQPAGHESALDLPGDSLRLRDADAAPAPKSGVSIRSNRAGSLESKAVVLREMGSSRPPPWPRAAASTGRRKRRCCWRRAIRPSRLPQGAADARRRAVHDLRGRHRAPGEVQGREGAWLHGAGLRGSAGRPDRRGGHRPRHLAGRRRARGARVRGQPAVRQFRRLEPDPPRSTWRRASWRPSPPPTFCRPATSSCFRAAGRTACRSGTGPSSSGGATAIGE